MQNLQEVNMFLFREAAVEVNTLAPLLGLEKQLTDPEVPAG